MAALLAAAAVACSSAPEPPPGGVVIRFGEHDLRAEVAATDSARARGLMFRRRLHANSGMVFLFVPDEPRGGFWMKNTLIPLSIAFLQRTGQGKYRVLDVLDMQPCRADPCRKYYPDSTYDAAVEASLGWFDRRGVRPGTPAEIVAGEEPTPT